MNTCESYAALLDAFAEGDLFTEDMVRVQQHLNNCPHCQTYLEDLLAIRAAFPTAEDTPVPPDFTANVMAAVAATPQAAPESAATPRKKDNRWLRILAPLAACCAIVILLQGIPGATTKEAAFDYAASVSATCDAPAEEPAAAAEPGAAEEQQKPVTEARITTDNATMDTGSIAESAPELMVEKEDSTSRYCISISVDAAYVGDLLDGYTPISADESKGELQYELTMAQYEAFLEALADRDELPAEEVFDTDSETVLVIVRQE